MSEKVQVNTMITVATRELLRQACHDRAMTQGEVIEAALQAFLVPGQNDSVSLRLEHIESILERIVGLFEATIPPTPAAKAVPPVATFDVMYGPVETQSSLVAETKEDGPGSDATAPHHLDTVSTPAKRNRWRGWFMREEST